MFQLSTKRVAFGTFVLGVGVVLGGCASSGPESLDTATASVDETRDQLDKGAQQVDAVMASLQDMRSGDDLKSAFKVYSNELDGLKKAAEKVRSRRAAMKTRMLDHIERWQAELANISNEEARQISQERQQQLTAAMQQLAQAMDELKVQYEPFETNLEDIRLVMANDLSLGGIKVADPIIKQAIIQAAEVKDLIEQVNNSMDSAIAQFRRAAPATGGGSPTQPSETAKPKQTN
jgi:predicted nuclease with TOPRIM domain